MKVILGFAGLFLSLNVFSSASFADPNLDCLDQNNQVMTNFNNAQVAQWKTTTPLQSLNRGYVEGSIDKLFPNETGHAHFSLAIDQNPADDVEIIYNIVFGTLPSLSIGQTIIACGDFINTGYTGGGASPDGAIIHWLHYNPGTRPSDAGHANGFLVINNQPYGFTNPGPGN
jgi:hypothetical protein